MLRIVAFIAVVGVMVLHNDFWNREPELEPVLGWIPTDMAYHTLWLVAASVTLWLVMRCTWRRGP